MGKMENVDILMYLIAFLIQLIFPIPAARIARGAVRRGGRRAILAPHALLGTCGFMGTGEARGAPVQDEKGRQTRRRAPIFRP